MGKSMQEIDVIEIYLRHLQGSEGVFQGKEMCILGEFVDDHQNSIVMIGLGKPLNEV
jgi:hypothetical protein